MSKDGLKQRIARVITGNMHSLVTLAEDANPDAIYEQAIREVDAAIVEVRTEHGKELIEKRVVETQLQKGKEEHGKLLQQIEVAIAQNEDGLAKAGIARQMDIEAQRTVLEDSLRDTNESLKKLEGYISALQAKKRDMQEAYDRKKKAERDVNKGETAREKATVAEETFNRVMGTNPLPEVSEDEAKLNDLEELERNNRIKNRLDALKNTVKRHD